jgi:hypothetical protein
MPGGSYFGVIDGCLYRSLNAAKAAILANAQRAWDIQHDNKLRPQASMGDLEMRNKNVVSIKRGRKSKRDNDCSKPV